MRIRIDIDKKSARVPGGIALPVFQLNFQLLQATEDQAGFLFDQFFKYFHKGGG
jgi:hypothetical protein